MARPARKFILIPEYRPLHAMVECFGPKHGPLTEPCPTPITVIGKLLMQKGDEALTIMEVLKNGDGTTTPPVRLTLENYTLKYEEILGGKTMSDPVTATVPVEPEGVSPVIVTPGEKHKIVEVADEVQVTNDTSIEEELPTVSEVEGMTTPATVMYGDELPVHHGDTGASNKDDAEEQLPYATTGYIAPVTDDITEAEETGEVVTVSSSPYAGMTKAQRKAARRAARMAEETSSTNAQEETNDVSDENSEPLG